MGFYVIAVYIAYMIVIEPINGKYQYLYSSSSFSDFGLIGKSFIIICGSLIALSFLVVFVAFIDLIIFQLIFKFSIIKKVISI